MYDPSDFTHPFPQRGTFLYSEHGAAPSPAPDTWAELERIANTRTPPHITRADALAARAVTIDGDRDTRVPTDPYRRTPAHAAPDFYTDADCEFCHTASDLYHSPRRATAAHARSDRAE